jgi:DNA-directed RNA polymerase subunit RPC12/RpoP
MNNSSIVTTTFCRKCHKLRSCLETKGVSKYNYLCKECARVEDLVVECINCGREATKDIIKHSGYCHLCEKDNISECSLCGAETYNNKLVDGICNKCQEGINKPCNKCGEYFHKDKLTSDNLCSKCSIKIHKRLKDSQVNEVVECIECGRECHVNDLDEGLCIYCKYEGLKSEIKRLKHAKRRVYY